MSETGKELDPPHLFARLTVELEDATTSAVKGQNARNTRLDHLRLARRVRAGLSRSTGLVDRIFEGIATAQVEDDQS